MVYYVLDLKFVIYIFLKAIEEYGVFDEDNTGLKSFSKLLLANNMIPNSLLLGVEGKIPDNCDVLVIAGAQEFLADREVKAIQQYLRKGGDALFLVENVIVTTPDKPLTEEQINRNPSLNKYTK